MITFVAGGFSSSSDSLARRLEKSLKIKAVTFKAGSGIGHLNIKIRTKKLIKLMILNKLKRNILVEQHLFPIKHNIEVLDSMFGLENIKFIVTYRNVFETINNLLKRKKANNTFHFLRSNYYPTYENFISEKYEINIMDALMVINFYAMWFKMEKQKYIKNIEFISFEDNTKNVDIVNKKLSSFLKLDLNLDQNIKTNLFKKEEFKLSDELKSLMIDYAKSFKDIDFSRVGL